MCISRPVLMHDFCNELKSWSADEGECRCRSLSQVSFERTIIRPAFLLECGMLDRLKDVHSSAPYALCVHSYA